MTSEPLKTTTEENAENVAKFKAEMKANPLPKMPKRILGNVLTVATYSRPDFRIIIEDDSTTIDEVLRPEYWANVGAKLEAEIKRFPFAIIEAIWADASKYLRLVVVDAGPLWAKVKVIESVDLSSAVSSPDADPAEPEFTVKYVNGSLKWCIMRTSDKEYIQKNLTSKAIAEKELSDLVRALKS